MHPLCPRALPIRLMLQKGKRFFLYPTRTLPTSSSLLCHSGAAASVSYTVAPVSPSSPCMCSDPMPTIVNSEQLITVSRRRAILIFLQGSSCHMWQDDSEGSTPTMPQGKQDQQEGVPDEGYTSAASDSTNVQMMPSNVAGTVEHSVSSEPGLTTATPSGVAVARVGPTGVAQGWTPPPPYPCLPPPPTPWNRKRSAVSPRMEHGVSDGNGDGPLPVCPDPDSGPGSGVPLSGLENGMKDMTNNTGIRPPPALALWLQCVVVALEMAWMTMLQISRALKSVLSRLREARDKQTPASGQDDKAQIDKAQNDKTRDDKAPLADDAPGDSSDVASSTNASGTSLEERFKSCFKSSLSFLFNLYQPTTMGSCSSSSFDVYYTGSC